MLRICTEQEYEKYVHFVYALALDPSKSGYPTYSDGILLCADALMVQILSKYASKKSFFHL